MEPKTERFVRKIAKLTPSPEDRFWAEQEGQVLFTEMRSEVPLGERLAFEKAWTKALFQISLSPRSGYPQISPEEYHFLLFPMLGKSGIKLMRLHRQKRFVAVPWLYPYFLERLRIDHLYHMKDWKIGTIDKICFDFSCSSVGRQLITVFACDYRIEQQQCFDGQASLLRACEHTNGLGSATERLRGTFCGQEDFLEDFAAGALFMWEEGAWQQFSRWLHCAATIFCHQYDTGDPYHIREALMQSWDQRPDFCSAHDIPAKRAAGSSKTRAGAKSNRAPAIGR